MAFICLQQTMQLYILQSKNSFHFARMSGDNIEESIKAINTAIRNIINVIKAF